MATPLKIQIVVDDQGSVSVRKFGQEVEKAGSQGETAFKRTGKSLDDMNKHAATAYDKILKIAGAAAGLYTAFRIFDSLKTAASDLNETLSKSNTIFGANAAEMTKWASNAATSFGLSQKAALENAATIGNMFKQLGAGTDVAAKNSKQMVELAADIASFHNVAGGAAQVLEAMQASFRGEYDSLQRYIPTIQAATVEQQALADTGKKSADQLTALEKATAAMTIIVRDAGDATGDFARTSGEAANQERILSAQIEDVKAGIGAGLLPVYRDILVAINDFIKANKDLIGVNIEQWANDAKAALTMLADAMDGFSRGWLTLKKAYLSTEELGLKFKLWANIGESSEKKIREEVISTQQTLADVTAAIVTLDEAHEKRLNPTLMDTAEGLGTVNKQLENTAGKIADPLTKNLGTASAALKITASETEHLEKALKDIEARLLKMQYEKAWEAQDQFDWVMGYGDVIDQLARDVEDGINKSVESFERGNEKIEASTDQTADAVTQIWADTVTDMRREFADWMGDWMTGELDEGENAFEAFCDSLKHMFASLISELIAYDLFGSLLGKGASGIGLFTGGTSGGGILGSLFGGGSSGGSGLLGTIASLASLGSTGYSLYNGGSGLLGGLISWIQGTNLANGMGGAYAIPLAFDEFGLGAGGASGMGSLGAMGSAGIMSVIAAAWAMGSQWLGEQLMYSNSDPSSLTIGARVKPSEASDQLFDLPELFSAFVSEGEWDSDDIKNASDAMAKQLYTGLSSLEQVFQWVGTESQGKLKDYVKGLGMEDWGWQLTQEASEGAPRSAWVWQNQPNQFSDTEWSTLGSSLTNFFGKWISSSTDVIASDFMDAWGSTDFRDQLTAELEKNGEISADTFADLIGLSVDDLEELFVGYSNSMNSGAEGLAAFLQQLQDVFEVGSKTLSYGSDIFGALKEIFGDEFEQYISEAVENIKSSEIFQFMTDDIQAAFDNVSIDDFENFVKVFGQYAADMSAAASIWSTLKNLGEGFEVSKLDQFKAMASAYGEAYKAITEAYTGEEMDEDELKGIMQKYFEALTDGAEGLDRALMGITDLDTAIGALNGIFDAYIAQMEELGVDVEKLTELEGLRQKAMAKLLEDYKHQLGLIGDEEYYTARMEKIMSQYAGYFSSPEELISWFTTASYEDIKALADELGIDWNDIANDVGWVIEAMEALGSTFEEWKAKLLGTTDEFTKSTIAERYGLSVSGMTEDWWKDILNAVKGMSEDEFNAWAEKLGVSASQLRSDLDALNAIFGTLGDTVSATAEDIRQAISDLQTKIADWTGSATQTSGAYASQIEAVLGKDLKDLTMSDLLDTVGIMDQWAEARKAEIEAEVEAQKESYQNQIDLLEEQRDVISEQIQVADRIERLVKSIDDTIRNIKYSNLNVSLPKEKFQESEQDYQTLLAAAMSGGTAEVQDYLSFVSTYLQQAQAEYKSSGAYQDIYAQVMADMEAIKAKAQSGGYDAAILEEIRNTNAELEAIDAQIQALQDAMNALEPDYSEIESQVAEWAAAIENLIAQIEKIDSILAIDWSNYEGEYKDVLEMLMTLVDTYGWDNEFVISWTSDMTEWLATQPIDDIIAFMSDIAEKVPGGWDSQYMLSFISDMAGWLADDVAKAKGVLDYLVSIFGDDVWTKDVTLTYLTGLVENGISWNDLKYALTELYDLPDDDVQKILTSVYYNTSPFTSWDEFMEAWTVLGMEDSWATKYLKTLYENGSITDEQLKSWSNFVLAFKQVGIDDAIAEKLLSAVYTYTGGDPALATWSAFKAVMTASGIGVDDEAWKTIKAAYNDSLGMFPTWTALKAALEKAGLDDTALKTIQGVYDSGDMTWTELEELLAATGVPSTVIREIEASVGADVTVTLKEMDYWTTSLAALLGILQNTGILAEFFANQSISMGDFGSAIGATMVQAWASKMSDSSVLEVDWDTVPDYTSGGSVTFPSSMTVSGTVGLSGNALTYLSNLNGKLWNLDYLYWSYAYISGIALKSYPIAVSGVGGYEYGGISSGPADGYLATLHGTELVVSPKSTYPATVISNGGTTQDGARAGNRDAEIELLRQQVELQKELIDTLRAKDTSPRVAVNVDANSLADYTGRYVSERTRRGTLNVRGN